MDSAKALSLLKSQGARMTTARRLVIEILEGAKEPMSTGSLLAKLEQKGNPVNKTTAYRELEFLKDSGIVSELDFGEGSKRYELVHEEHHHHFVCMKCKKVQEIELEKDLNEVEKIVARKTGAKVTSHMLEFFGVCSDCQ